MSLKITPGRLVDVLQIKTSSDDTDDYGDPLPPHIIYPNKRGEVEVRSGDELIKYGSSVTSELITVLMYLDTRITSDMIMEWDGLDYIITHIRPIRHERSMIVTAEIQTNGGDN